MAVGVPGTVVVVDEDDELPHPASTDAAASAPTAVIAHPRFRRMALPRLAPADPGRGSPERTTAPP